MDRDEIKRRNGKKTAAAALAIIMALAMVTAGTYAYFNGAKFVNEKTAGGGVLKA